MVSVFREAYGNTMQNRILEYLLERRELDFAVCDMARTLNISKPKAYEIVKKFEKKNFVKKSRIIGKTQLYILDRENKWVKIHVRNFDEALNIAMEEYEKKHPEYFVDERKQMAVADKKAKYRKSKK